MDSLTIKTWLGDDVRRFTVSAEKPLTFEQLVSQVSNLYPTVSRVMFGRAGNLTLQWTDSDGDRVSITNDLELLDALTAAAGADRVLRVRIHARPRTLPASASASVASASPVPSVSASASASATPLTLDDEYEVVASPEAPAVKPQQQQQQKKEEEEVFEEPEEEEEESATPVEQEARPSALAPATPAAPAAPSPAGDKPKPIDLGSILSSVFTQVTTELGKVSQHLQELSEKQRAEARRKAEERRVRKEAEQAERERALRVQGELGLTDPMEHAGVVCDGCQGPIFGSRFKCAECDDFDLCWKCESRGLHPGHILLRMRVPVQMGGPAPQRRRHGHGWRAPGVGDRHQHHHQRQHDLHAGHHHQHHQHHQHAHRSGCRGGGRRGFPSWIINDIIDSERLPVNTPADTPATPAAAAAPSKPQQAAAAPEHLGAVSAEEMIEIPPVDREEQPAQAQPAQVPQAQAAPSRFSDEVRMLKEMGFEDATQIVSLLDQFRGNVEEVLAQLLG